MGLFDEVKNLENNMFTILALSFEAMQNLDIGELKAGILALVELDKEYEIITKVKWIKPENMERLAKALIKMETKDDMPIPDKTK